VKLDQRNGRAHRIGQMRASVRAIYFLPEERSRIVETIASKNRTRRRILQPRVTEIDAPGVLDLPQRLPGDSPALDLIRALRAAGLTPPLALWYRHRAGIELLFAEMAGEYLDGRRLAELDRVLERERIVTNGMRR
ncbi:MAG: hypothetical protein ACRD3J_22000, partial [Thermoanaerobaculia bacterium]